jgi:hypothetical protein
MNGIQVRKEQLIATECRFKAIEHRRGYELMIETFEGNSNTSIQ